jgi:hypothetical protein
MMQLLAASNVDSPLKCRGLPLRPTPFSPYNSMWHTAVGVMSAWLVNQMHCCRCACIQSKQRSQDV